VTSCNDSLATCIVSNAHHAREGLALIWLNSAILQTKVGMAVANSSFDIGAKPPTGACRPNPHLDISRYVEDQHNDRY
jgi:hypothetical protein